MKIEKRYNGGRVFEVKEETRNGVKIGIIEGYIATWDIDRGDYFGIKDQFIKGAFLASIMEHKNKNRQIRFNDHHGRTVGGFPIDTVREDDKGLFGVGEVNLEVQQGREAYMLAKQGVLVDFSIGFSVEESTLDEQNDLRTITKATVWEGSIVSEPMNPAANVTAVKDNEGKIYQSDDVKKFTKRSLEKALKECGAFTNNAAKIIASKSTYEGPVENIEPSENKCEVLDILQEISSTLVT